MNEIGVDYMLVGYARVSTQEQNLDRQIDMLVRYGVDKRNIYQEKITGTVCSLSLIHISEPTRPLYISYAVFCLKKKKKKNMKTGIIQTAKDYDERNIHT
eukprot:TRINITY_DN10212_c0_g1_i2.p4 TRINITY_DN10212_c0_g1~~TRINITY_DN10212_c0_g1_i2.p4  ORF type:complete len:100 (-),score=17.80 TRINITY_DN10212_c0_g1_i2:60-359(-)